MTRIGLWSRVARRALVAIVAATVALGAAVAVAAPHSQPVLGSKRFIDNPNAKGYGEFAPKGINNDGDPGGTVTGIVWRHWGRRVTTATGISSIEKPGGGWIGNQRIELRASHLGRCVRGGPRAYRSLEIREPSLAGGPLGAWRLWGRDLCRRL